MLKKIFGNSSSREIKRIMPTVNKILALHDTMGALDDDSLRQKTKTLQELVQNNGVDLDDLLPEAFAVVREAARRVLGEEPYPVQLMAGILLHQGRIAEQKTGEGKSLTCAMPAYLNALTGKGVHVVTVNDYLASRDAERIGGVHRFLGLTVGCVLADMTTDQRKAEYDCDITYITNNELGFDYLRDNMATALSGKVQRGLVYAIVDEVDSVLIDEARTPLIISGAGEESTGLYRLADVFVRRLKQGSVPNEDEDVFESDGDYFVEPKEKRVTLTDAGIQKAEKFFNLENYADPDNLLLQHHVNAALRANTLMHKDKDYIVNEDEILIVDEFTGRVMPGRRYSDGLHQAIEAKEYVKVRGENHTLATITFQNFFNKYQKKSGMTGTAKTEETEFRDIYGMDVVEVPTNRPVIRIDDHDKVYKTKKEKYAAVVEDIAETHKTGQPVLVGTVTIEVSELLSGMLKRRGIRHSVLNAKYHAQEAEIIAMAGQHGAVTIATNMAGRGTDIKLDDEAKKAGGLKVIGTERHESRRIDNQLRGRSGRQGDPGESVFYISLEDDLLKYFGQEHLMEMFTNAGMTEGEPIQHKMLSSAIERAQKQIEYNHFETRKQLLGYDQVMNEQREIVYQEREHVLAGDSMHDTIIQMMRHCINRQIEGVLGAKPKQSVLEWDTKIISNNIREIVPWFPEVCFKDSACLAKRQAKEQEIKEKELNVKLPPVWLLDAKQIRKLEDFENTIWQSIETQYKKKTENPQEAEFWSGVERHVLLKIIDQHWKTHIDDMDILRQGIGLSAYGQKDPTTEYRIQGYQMFGDMITGLEEDVTRTMVRARKIVAPPKVVVLTQPQQKQPKEASITQPD